VNFTLCKATFTIETMKSTNTPHSVTRESRFSKISQKHGLIVAVLTLASLLLQSGNPTSSGILAIAAFAALIFSFVSGYKRSDELEKLVQLKAAAISFMVVMFMTFGLYVSGLLNYKAPEETAGIILTVGFLLHLFLLPAIAKRTHEK
jgi:hypothetical protein